MLCSDPGFSPEAGEPLKELKERTGVSGVSSSVPWSGVFLLPAGLNHSQAGPPWRDVTGLVSYPEKQKNKPPSLTVSQLGM